MTFNLPPRIRAIIYIITALGTPVIGYLFANHNIDQLVVALWGAEVTAVNAMAAFNVSTK